MHDEQKQHSELFAKVRDGIQGDEDDPTMYVQDAYAALASIEEQLEAAEGLRRAALHVGMWGAPYHEALAEAVKRYEAVSSPASEPKA